MIVSGPQSGSGASLAGAARLLLRLALLLALALTALARPASAGTALQLDSTATGLDAWPHVRMLADPTRAMGIDEVLARRSEFLVPDVPAGNFGPRRDALWLQLPVAVAGAERRWLLEVDYAPLSRIDLFVVAGGRVRQRLTMGGSVPDRPIVARSHVAPLDLLPDSAVDIYLRIESPSTLMVPIRLHHESGYVASESRRMVLQGLMFGTLLVLFAMTVYSGIGLGERVFLYYGMLLFGVSMFLVGYSGLGDVLFGTSQAALLERVRPLGALLAVTGASFFVIEALDVRQRNPWMATSLQLTATAAATALIASVLDLIDYRQASLAATIIGPIQIVLAFAESIRQALGGRRIAFFMVIGWGSYAIGSLSLAMLLRGWLPANLVTQNLFQVSSVIEMLVWMRVLTLRIEDVRHRAEQDAVEKQALYALAHTDSLTGLANRRGLKAALNAALPQAGAGRIAGLFLVDLDGFKAVNDRLGHEAGDEVLIEVGRRLRHCVRGGDVIARIGGDEFIVLVLGLPSAAAATTIGRKMLAAIREPIDAAGATAGVGATIGFALAPEDGVEADALLRAADAAMYGGKQAGRMCVRRAEPAATDSV